MRLFSNGRAYRDSLNHLIRSEKDIRVTTREDYKNSFSDPESFKDPKKLNKGPRAEKSENGVWSCYQGRDDDGNIVIYEVLVSAYTHEVIPFECLCYPTLYILCAGLSGNCKTTNILQYIDEVPDILFRSGYTGYDTILERYQYPPVFSENLEEYSKKNLPESNNRNGLSEAIPTLCTFNGKKYVLQFIDVPGEKIFEAGNESWYSCDAVFFFLDASIPDARPLIDRAQNMLSSPQLSRRIPLYVILTKADLVPELTEQIPNSLVMEDGMTVMQENRDGYDWKIYENNEKRIKAYLTRKVPRVLNKLQRFDCRFFLVGNYMEEVNRVPDNLRYRIETPILHFLAENGLYESAPESASERTLERTSEREEEAYDPEAGENDDNDAEQPGKKGFINWVLDLILEDI